MPEIRPDCLPLPKAMVGRPVDPRGYPVPWFASRTADGYDFRVVEVARRDEAVRHRKCWVSGEPLGRFAAFVIGPMCTVNTVSADPPVRPDLAYWSARVCPFLTRPLAVRNERGLEGLQDETPGIAIKHNPGVCAVWVTRFWTFDRDGLFRFGEPHEIRWYARGRAATRAEVVAAFERGFPRLQELADAEGAAAQAALARARDAAVALWPAEAAA